MKLAKPQWHLLTYVLPPIFASLGLIIFFPVYLFQFLIAIIILAAIISGFIGIKNISTKHQNTSIRTLKPDKGLYSWLFSLAGLIFLLGISAIFFIFLTAASQLSPEKLNFGEVIHTWHTTFLAGICLLLAQLLTTFIPEKRNAISAFFLKKIDTKELEKMHLSSQIFLRLSGLVVLVVSLSVVILTITNGIMRWLGFTMPTGLQLQTMIVSTLIYLPFTTKRWRKRRFLKSHRSRSYRCFKLMIGLIIAITFLSIITLPLAGAFIPVEFLSHGLATVQWELFILAWWVGITPIITNKIIALSRGRSLSQMFVILIISSISVYELSTKFLLNGGEEYFLAVVREGVPALILTTLPLGILVLIMLPFQEILPLKPTRFKQQKFDRNEQYLTHALIQMTVIGCILYWVSGLSLLFILLLMLTIPRLMMFLLVDMGINNKHRTPL